MGPALCVENLDCRGARQCDDNGECQGVSGCPTEAECQIDESVNTLGFEMCQYDFDC